MKLTGLTVEQVIAELQKQNPKALVIVPAGDGTVYSVSGVKEQWLYQHTTAQTFCGTQYMSHGEKMKRHGGVESVLIE